MKTNITLIFTITLGIFLCSFSTFAQIVVDDFNTGAFSVTGPFSVVSDMPASGAIGGLRSVSVDDLGGGPVPSVMSLTPGNGYLNLAVNDNSGNYEIGWGASSLFLSVADLNLNASSYDRIVVTLSQAPTSGQLMVFFNRPGDADEGLVVVPLNGAGDYTFLFTHPNLADVNTSDIDGISIIFFSGVPAGSTIRVESVTIGAPQRNLSINNVSLNEADAGTTSFDFTVSLDLPAGTGGVTFDIATADGTAQDDNPATEDNDYVAKSLTSQTIPAGSSTYTFSVTVNGDLSFEPDETFFVNVTNVSGATLGDGQGQGTITNDDVSCAVFTDNRAYVNASATGANSGASWTDAFTDLQDALATANACPGITEIWVAEGIYKPTTGANRNISFVMKNNLAIYGGFNGTETQLSQRDWVANMTTLSGDLLGNDGPNFTNNSDNSTHVISNTGLDNSAVLDGFTVTAANAILQLYGGGMRNNNSSPTVTNCIFSVNMMTKAGVGNDGGGGMVNLNSSPIVTNCTFYGNVTDGNGGGMYNQSGSTPTVTNCVFSGNTAQAGGGMCNLLSSPNAPIVTNCTFFGNNGTSFGGGVYLSQSPTVFTNCTFSGNSAGSLGGGGLFIQNSSPTITNCSISGNTATGSGGGIRLFSSSNSPTVKNSILWNNSGDEIFIDGGSSISVTYSIVEQASGVYPGTGNLNADPLFVSGSDFHLQPGSPAINTGINTGAPTSDIEGNPRPLTVANPADMGAYEFQGVLQTFYRDEDEDGYGDAANSIQAFIAPDGYVSDDTDCDDADDAVNPGAAEICDGIDNNCDGTIDEGFTNTDGDGLADCADTDDDNDGTPDASDCAPLDAAKWRTGDFYTDGDNDGYGSGSTVNLCYGATTPAGYSTTGGDCNDANPNIKPGAAEICDGIDNNCDGTIDEGFTNTDGDGLADCADTDDDNDGTPDASDCAPLDAAKWRTGDFYTDGDDDGYGSGSTVNLCYGANTPTGFSTAGGDCNDANANIKPGAPEICDGVDNNCDGNIDEGFTNTDGDALADCVDTDDDNDGTPDGSDCAPLDATKWRTGSFYTDGDNDGYGSGSTVSLCYGATMPTGYSAVGGDCNDANAGIKPGAAEICGNNIDDNCNGQADEGCSTCNLTATVSAGTISCYGGLTTITVKASGGKIPYQYKLSGGLTFQLYNTFIVGAGTYSVTVKDKTGCTKTISNIVITQPAPLTLTLIQKKDVTCRNGSNGLINVSAGGGTSPYSYKLNSGSYRSSGLFQNLKAGIYTVTAKDAKGCYKSISVTIKNGSGSCSGYALTGKTLGLFDAKLSPNPAVNEFTLQVSGNSSVPVNIRVVDIYGKTRHIIKGAAGQSYRFGQQFAAGVYIIEIIQGENRKIIKAIKQ